MIFINKYVKGNFKQQNMCGNKWQNVLHHLDVKLSSTSLFFKYSWFEANYVVSFNFQFISRTLSKFLQYRYDRAATIVSTITCENASYTYNKIPFLSARRSGISISLLFPKTPYLIVAFCRFCVTPVCKLFRSLYGMFTTVFMGP